MKTCTGCKAEKPLSDYYKHPATPDGHASKCKECAKAIVKAARLKNIEHYRSFDKARAMKPDRVAARSEYQKTEAGKSASARARAKYAEKNREAINAKNRVENMSPEQLANKRESARKHMKTDLGRASIERTNAKHPMRRAARIALGNAVRDGRVIPWPTCSIPQCCDKPEAHHPDYDRPLDVVWLCHAHHKQAHALVKA